MNCLNIGVTSSVEVGIVVIIVVVLVCVNATVSVFNRCSKLHKVLFLALSVTKFVNHISWEPLNGFVPNSRARHVWSLARTSLNVKGQCHQGQKRHVHSHHPLAATEWNALAANGNFGGVHAVCM